MLLAMYPPAFVMSLDFELHWGVRDLYPLDSSYTANLLGARTVIPKLLTLFHEFEVAATWATVGFLFTDTKEELLSYHPQLKPSYQDSKLDPYREALGDNEHTAPLQYAKSLIELIRQTPRQELASHTYSHYYCLEAGQTEADFRADLASAKAIAEAQGIQLESIIFPRNQLNPAYAQALLDNGIRIYRGNEPGYFYEASTTAEQTPWRRAGRLLDTYVPITPHHLGDWTRLREASGLINIPATRFLRPYTPKLRALEPLRLKRITDGMKLAARQGRIYHLWWHPHNLGLDQENNLGFLRQIFLCYQQLAQDYGMRSLSMKEVARLLDEV